MYARLVLPRPGGPTSRTWSSASPRVIAAVSATSSCSFSRSWPTNSAEVPRPQRAVELVLVLAQRRREELRLGRASASVHAACSQRLARTRSSAGRLGIDLGEGALGLDERVAELDERVAGDEVPVAAPAVGAASTPTPTFSFSSSTTRCAVFLPIPGIASNRAVSSSTIARRSSSADEPGDDRERDLRPDAADGEQVLEQLALGRVGEPVELERVLADVQVASRATTSSSPLGLPQRARRGGDEVADAVDVEHEAVRTPRDRLAAQPRDHDAPHQLAALSERRRERVADRDRERVGGVRAASAVAFSPRIACTIRCTCAFSARP